GPPTILFYNRGQEYTRRKIDAVDSSDWFMIAPDVAREIVSRYDESARDRAEDIFKFVIGPATAGTYLVQRRLLSALSSGADIDSLEVEETVLGFVDAAVRDVLQPLPCVRRRPEAAVERVKALIGADPSSNDSLRSLAEACGSSPFQLCRAFRRATGSTITGYRHALRLRIALEALHDTRADVTTIALDLGYSSHSHFTKFFRQRFGMTPSEFRRRSALPYVDSVVRDLPRLAAVG